MQMQYEDFDIFFTSRQLPMSSNSMMMGMNNQGGPNSGMMGPRPILPPKPMMPGSQPMMSPNQTIGMQPPSLPPKPGMMMQNPLGQSGNAPNQQGHTGDPFATNPQQRTVTERF